MKIHKYLSIPTIALSVAFFAGLAFADAINTGGQKGVSRTATTWQFGQGTFNIGVTGVAASDQNGIYYTDSNGVNQKDSPSLYTEDLFFAIGLTNWADLSVDLPFYQDSWDRYGTSTGLGDLGVAMKLAHVGLDQNAPFRVAYLGRFTFPTGSVNEGYIMRHPYYGYLDTVQHGVHSFGAGGIRFQPQILWTLDFSKFPSRYPWAIHADLGPNLYLATVKQSYLGSSAAFVGSFALEFFPRENLSFYSEFSGELIFNKLEEGANPILALNDNALLYSLGVMFKAQNGLRVDFGLDLGLSDSQTRINMVASSDSMDYSIVGSPKIGAHLTLAYEHRGEKARYALGRFFGTPDDTVKIIKHDTLQVTKYDTVKVVKNDTMIVVKRDTLVEVRRDTVQVQVRDTIRIKDTQDRQNIIQYGVVVFRNLNFRLGSATLLPSSYPVLDDIVASMQKYPEVKIEVRGYTDVTGSMERNKTLSQERAQSVVDYLISKGIGTDRLRAYGMGNSEPIADNSTNDGRVLNRRVEIKRVDAF